MSREVEVLRKLCETGDSDLLTCPDPACSSALYVVILLCSLLYHDG